MNAQQGMEREVIGGSAVDFFQLAVSGAQEIQISLPETSPIDHFAACIPAGFFEQIQSAVSTVGSATSLSSINRSGKRLLNYYAALANNLTAESHQFAAPIDTLVQWLDGTKDQVPEHARLHDNFSRFLSITLKDGKRIVTAPLGDTVVLPFGNEWTFVVQPVGLGSAKPNPRVSAVTDLSMDSLNWRPYEPTAFALLQNGIVVAGTPQSLQRATAEALFGNDPVNAIKATVREYQATMQQLYESLGQHMFDHLHPVLEPMTVSWVLAPMIMRQS